jgi:hypothetical protein
MIEKSLPLIAKFRAAYEPAAAAPAAAQPARTEPAPPQTIASGELQV